MLAPVPAMQVNAACARTTASQNARVRVARDAARIESLPAPTIARDVHSCYNRTNQIIRARAPEPRPLPGTCLHHFRNRALALRELRDMQLFALLEFARQCGHHQSGYLSQSAERL